MHVHFSAGRVVMPQHQQSSSINRGSNRTSSASSIAVPSMPISPLLSPCCLLKARGLILRARICARM
jgi:hypothetical protein